MESIIYELGKILPYLIIFPVFVLFFYIFTIVLSKKKISDKNVGIYGVLMNFDNYDVLKISLLVVCYLFIIESIIIVDSSYYSINFILLPIVCFEIINHSYLKILLDLVEIGFVYFILIFKNIFYSYLINVNVLWYIVVLYIILCIFIFLFATYLLFENINVLMSKKMKKVKGINENDKKIEKENYQIS